MTPRRAPANPFVPTFGADPYVIVGRDPILDGFGDAFAHLNPGAPGLTVLIDGERGMGKTVLLNEYEAAAREQGWLAISESGSPGLLDRLSHDHLPRLLAEHDPQGRTRLTSASAGVAAVGSVAITWTDRHPAESSLRSQLTDLTDLLRPHDTGVVVTVDEIHAADTEELRKLGEILQFSRRERRLVGFAAAGLSSHLDRFLAHPGTTFLRRAERHTIGDVRLTDARRALELTITEAGRRISPTALDRAAAATGGYPFLIQLIGYESWRQHPAEPTISDADVHTAIPRARRALGARVHAPALQPLSDVDRAYLRAMAVDGDGPSHTATIAQRMGVRPDYAQHYRARLLAAGVIEAPQRGLVRFTIPGLGDYLLQREHDDAEEARLQRLAGSPPPLP